MSNANTRKIYARAFEVETNTQDFEYAKVLHDEFMTSSLFKSKDKFTKFSSMSELIKSVKTALLNPKIKTDVERLIILKEVCDGIEKFQGSFESKYILQSFLIAHAIIFVLENEQDRQGNYIGWNVMPQDIKLMLGTWFKKDSERLQDEYGIQTPVVLRAFEEKLDAIWCNRSAELLKYLEQDIELKKLTSFKSNANVSCPTPRVSQSNIAGGAKPTKKYNGRSYVVRTGTRGGKYILVKGTKMYV